MSDPFIHISPHRWLNPAQIQLVEYEPRNMIRKVYLVGQTEPLRLCEAEIQVLLNWLAVTSEPN